MRKADLAIRLGAGAAIQRLVRSGVDEGSKQLAHS
jgi:hypothetical protein